MPDQIPPFPQRRGYPLTPKTRTPIPSTKRLLEPVAELNRPALQPLLPDLEPREVGRRRSGAVVVGAVRHPCNHGTDGVHPVLVDCGDVIAGAEGDVGAGGEPGYVARK